MLLCERDDTVATGRGSRTWQHDDAPSDVPAIASMALSMSTVLRTPVMVNSTPKVGAAGVIVAR
jgi:hypothetical protein